MDDITNMGFIGKMQSFADTPSAQLRTEQANNSRIITKTRYIVEVVNGRIKKWFNILIKLYVHYIIKRRGSVATPST